MSSLLRVIIPTLLIVTPAIHAQTPSVTGPALPGMELPPHPMLLGEDEGDYYRGNLHKKADPGEEAVQ